LAQADVGIALGPGFNDATPSAGVTLVRGELRGVLRARRLARAAVGIQKQNLLFVFGYTALAVPLAVGALRPYLGFLVDPMVAVAAAGWCSLMVLANGVRLRWQEI
jgi:Cu+-exporting ATPase